MKRTSLTEKMILYFVALGIGSIVITGLFSFNAARRALLERSYNQLTSVRLTRKSAVERFFHDRLNETAFLAERGGGLEQLPASGYYTGMLEGEAGKEMASQAVNMPMAFVAECQYDGGRQRKLVTVCRNRKSGEVVALVVRQELIDSIMLEVSPRHGLGYSGETYLVYHGWLCGAGIYFLCRSPF